MDDAENHKDRVVERYGNLVELLEMLAYKVEYGWLKENIREITSWDYVNYEESINDLECPDMYRQHFECGTFQ